MSAAKAGQVEFSRREGGALIHAGIGKASFDDAKLLENIRALADAVQKAKPTGAKGTYLQKAALSSSMGPGVRVDVASIAGGRGRIGIRPGFTPRMRRRGGDPSEPVHDQT